MHPYILPVYSHLKKEKNQQNAVGMKAYLLHQFDFFGVKTPERDAIVHTYIKKNKLSKRSELEKVIKELWLMDQRELQYFAIDIFKYHQELWDQRSARMIEYCITHKSWWDTVDGIVSDWLHDFFKTFPELTIPVTSKWNLSANIWLQRSSILFQKAAKKHTSTVLLSEYILKLADSKEFFIQKAIGWALREYGKTNPEWVINFVATNSLSGLSKREALKRIEKDKTSRPINSGKNK